MIRYLTQRCVLAFALGTMLALLPIAPSVGSPIVEEKYDVLQVGTRSYTNVTVTTKAKTYVFIQHDAGLASIKVSQLPLDVQEELGYAVPKPATNTATAWAKREMAKINVAQVKTLEKRMEQKWREQPSFQPKLMGMAGTTLIVVVLGISLLFWFFCCYCLMLICRKTGNPGGVLVWLPFFQVFPAFRAAGMSYWWVLAYLVPILNLVPSILWCFKIAQARGKSFWVGVFLLLPVTSFFAFLYLAFSDGAEAEDDGQAQTKVMTLQTA